MKHISGLLISIVILTLVICGCSGSKDPVVPVATEPPVTINERIGQVYHFLWGTAAIECDMESGDVELIPSRNSLLHLNVAKPIVASMGMSVEFLPAESDPANGRFAMNISLTHPFSGEDRFTGFDVKGIMMTPGTTEMAEDLIVAGLDETQLVNRDGLTRWWNPTEFTGNGILGYYPGIPGTQDAATLTARINPYKIFADSLDAESPIGDLILPLPDDNTGRAVFSAGATNTRKYVIQFPVSGGPVVVFNYAVDASWGPPLINPPDEVPDDFPINANQPEPFGIRIIFPENTLQYLEGGEVVGNLRIRAVVSDWQGLMDGNVQDEIDAVGIFSPDLFIEPVELSYVTESFDHAVYEADVTQYLLPLYDADPRLVLVMARNGNLTESYTQGGLNPGPEEPLMAFQTAVVEMDSVTCEEDGNNQFADAEALDLSSSFAGTLCNPGGSQTDYRDFYTFDVPATGAIGGIGLSAEVEPVSVSLYDETHTELGNVYVSDGYSVLDDPMILNEGTYYIRVMTENETQMVYYEVFNDFTEDPCGDTLDLSFETKVDIPQENNVYTGRRSTLAWYNHVWVVYSEGSIGDGSILIRHSQDNGLSFEPPVQVNHLATHCTRQWPSIARDPLSGDLYCAWVEYSSGYPEPWVSRSEDNGSSWSNGVNIYDFETAPLQNDNEPRSIQIDVDGSGRLHAVWMDARSGLEQDIFYSYSDDMGSTWEPAELVDESNSSIQMSETGLDMDVNNSGRVVVAWTDRRHILTPPLTSLDIYFDTRTSTTPFGTDVMVNPPTLNIEQTRPCISITDDGIIHAAWVDRRNDGSFGGSNPPNTWELYYARSEDSGVSFIAETEIPTTEGYSTSTYMAPRIDVSPWGNPYVYFIHENDILMLSQSCDLGDTWEIPVTIFPHDPDTYIMSNISFDIGIGGQVYALHADTRNEPGPDYTHWNLYLEGLE